MLSHQKHAYLFNYQNLCGRCMYLCVDFCAFVYYDWAVVAFVTESCSCANSKVDILNKIRRQPRHHHCHQLNPLINNITLPRWMHACIDGWMEWYDKHTYPNVRTLCAKKPSARASFSLLPISATFNYLHWLSLLSLVCSFFSTSFIFVY